jgi:hypothetical protein
MAALLPGYALKEQQIFQPPRANLPGAQLITATEKPWRQGTTIVAVYLRRFRDNDDERHNCGDVGVVLLKGTTTKQEVVAKSDLVPAQPGIAEEFAQNPHTGLYDCRAPVSIDTASFRLNGHEVAFGVRLRYDLLIKTETKYRESLNLYRVDGAALKTILSLDTETCDCASTGGRGCGKMVAPTENCDPADPEQYRKSYLRMLPTQTGGMFDIEVLQETAPGEKPSSVGVLHWDGTRYAQPPQPLSP